VLRELIEIKLGRLGERLAVASWISAGARTSSITCPSAAPKAKAVRA
jgi:hypothetical protein